MFQTFPAHWPEKHQWLFLGAMALSARLAFFAYPASSDVSRYIWEGYILNKGFNPYLFPPDSPALRPYVIDVWHQISHKDQTACYPPLAMLFFRLAAAVSPTVPCFKALVVTFDLAAIWILALLLRSCKSPPGRLMLYALNPLVLVFVAGEGHLDAIQVFFILLGLLLFTKNRDGPAFFSLGCAVMSKYFAALIAPFLLNARNWKKIFYLIGAMAIFYLPFGKTGSGLFSSLLFFGTVNAYNDSITLLFRVIWGPYGVFAGMAFLAFCLAVIFVLVHNPMRSSYLALASLLLVLQTLNPWYLVLIAPFLALFPSRAWFFLQIAVVPALYLQYHTATFYRSYWITALEYLPFFALLLWDTYHKKNLFPAHRFAPVGDITAIVPVLNEAEKIGACVDALQKEEAVSEIIVVDAGSTDGTRQTAEGMGAEVLNAPQGRGLQIKAGIEPSRGDVILIVHADCVLKRNAAGRILSKLNSRPECIGGACEMNYIGDSVASRLLERLNNSRSRWTGISFGDQAQFFRREALPLIGGYPALMLMEDVELSMRLKEVAPLCLVSDGVSVSKRRWEKTGFWANGFRVVHLCFNYFIRRRLLLLDPTARSFYERYYGKRR